MGGRISYNGGRQIGSLHGGVIMNKETVGKVVSASKQWWFKVNTKAIRVHPLDGAAFPYIIKVSYTVDGKEYTKRKWIKAGKPVPAVGSSVTVIYDDSKPNKANF